MFQACTYMFAISCTRMYTVCTWYVHLGTWPLQICRISMDMYGYVWIFMDIYWPQAEHIRLVVLDQISILDIHTYPLISIDIHQRYPIYPHFLSKNDIFTLSMLLSIKVSIHIHFPLCISMYIQMRYPSQIYIDIHKVYPCTNHLHIQIVICCIQTYPLISSLNLIRYPFIIFIDIHPSYLCIIHAVIYLGIHSYPFSTLHIHVYSNEISILDIH